MRPLIESLQRWLMAWRVRAALRSLMRRAIREARKAREERQRWRDS